MGYRYDKLGYAIAVQLKDGYSVRANILREKENTYYVTFELGHCEIAKWDCLDGQLYTIQSENINTDVCKLIEEKRDGGFFDRFIERYEYELKCFEIGNDAMEMMI